MSKTLRLLAVFMIPFILSSCVNDDYDLSNVDMTIQVGGAKLALPLGADTVRVQSLFSGMGVDLIKRLDDGSYAFSMADSIDFTENLPDFTEAITIKGVPSASKSLKIPSSSQDIPSTGPQLISFPKITHKIDADIDVSGAKDIKSMKTVMVENAKFHLGFDLNNYLNGKIVLKVTFPKTYIFEEGFGISKDGDRYVYNNTADIIRGKYTMPPLQLLGLNFEEEDFGASQDQVFTAQIQLECTISLTMSSEDECPKNIQLTSTMTDFSPVSAEGILKLDLENVNEALVLEGIPDFMRSDDCVLDLANPSISFELSSNAGLPVNGELTLMPYFGGKEFTDAAQTIKFELPKSPKPEITKSVKYWIAESNKNMPDDYILMHSETLSEIFKKIPDSIVVSMNGTLDPDQSHILDFNADYLADVKYDLRVPFAFGNEFKLNIRDTIADIPDAFSEILNAGGLELFGEVESSLPLQLELEMIAIDEDGNPIKLTTSDNVIESCDKLGKSVTSDISVNLKRVDGLKSKITTLIMSFNATAPDTENIPINDDDFLVVDLKARIPNGITINDNNKD